MRFAAICLPLLTAVAIASCDSATDPRSDAQMSVVVNGVTVFAHVDAAQGSIVFRLSNPSDVTRSVGFYGCDIGFALYDRESGDLRLDSRSEGGHACRDVVDGVSIPPGGFASYTRMAIAADVIPAAVPDEADREFLIYIRFPQREPVWLENFPQPVPLIVTVLITPATPTVAVNETTLLRARVTGFNGDTTVVWKSFNSSVATVSASGLVTGLSPGVADIVASVGANSAIRGAVRVTVTQ